MHDCINGSPQRSSSDLAHTRPPHLLKHDRCRCCKGALIVSDLSSSLPQNVDIANFGESFADGLAFCAILHYFIPAKIPYSSLNEKSRVSIINIAKLNVQPIIFIVLWNKGTSSGSVITWISFFLSRKETLKLPLKQPKVLESLPFL